MPFKKGEGGRPRGTKNKATAALKDMILGALEAEGGETYLRKQARENPTAFLTLIGKVLPTQLGADGPGLKKLVLEWRETENES